MIVKNALFVVGGRVKRFVDELKVYDEFHEHINNMRAIEAEFKELSVENPEKAGQFLMYMMVTEMKRLEGELKLPATDMPSAEVQQRVEFLRALAGRYLPSNQSPPPQEDSPIGLYL